MQDFTILTTIRHIILPTNNKNHKILYIIMLIVANRIIVNQINILFQTPIEQPINEKSYSARL